MDTFSPETMHPADREKFLIWYSEQGDKAFNFQEGLLKYCKLDVKIL